MTKTELVEIFRKRGASVYTPKDGDPAVLVEPHSNNYVDLEYVSDAVAEMTRKVQFGMELSKAENMLLMILQDSNII